MSMTANDIRSRLSPFQPFRLVSTKGDTYHIQHPGLVMVGQSSVLIGTPAPGSVDVFVRFLQLPLDVIARIDQMPEEPAKLKP